MNDSMIELRETFQAWLQQRQEQVVNLDSYTPEPSQYQKIPIYYDDDDDEESFIPLRDIIISGLPPWGFVDKFVRDPNKTYDSSQRPPQNCPKCGNPVDGLYCQQCALLRKKLEEVWFTICDENEILNTFESSNDITNVVNVPQEPFIFN
ncbi:hypothetical protein Tco_1105394 [Tanacetum coccineum]